MAPPVTRASRFDQMIVPYYDRSTATSTLQHKQSISQSINQSFDQSFHQSFNQSISHSFNQSFSQPVNQSCNQSTSHFKYLVSSDGAIWPNDHLVPFSHSQSIYQSINNSINHSINQSKSLAYQCVDNVTLPLCFQFLDLLSLANCRSINHQWNNQSKMPFSYQSTNYSISQHEQWISQSINQSINETKRPNSLTINNQFVRSLVNSFPHLQSINLSKPQSINQSIDQSKIFHYQYKLTERSLFLLSQLNSLICLSINQCNQSVTDRSILYLTTNLTKLTKLSVNHCDQLTNQSLLYISTGRFSHSLIDLSMIGCSKLSDLTCLKKLKLQSLHLSNTSRLFAHSFSSLSINESIENLSLASTHITSHAFKQSINQSINSLKRVDLSQCADLTDDVIPTLVTMKNLTVLSLNDCARLSINAWKRCLNSSMVFRSLLSLDVSCTLIDDEAFSCLSKLTPNLQIISINQCTLIKSLSCLQNCLSLHTINANLCHSLIDLHGLEKLKNLKILRLWDCFTLNDQSLLPVLRFCNSLMKLNVCSCRGLTDLTVMRWCKEKCLPDLKVLNVRFCEGMSEDSKHVLRQKKTNWQVIG